MPERFELAFEVTRQDVLAASEAAMRESPAWQEAQAEFRRGMRRQALFAAPFCIVGGALTVGRGLGTQGMYWEGAALGAAFAAFLFFALPRLNNVEKARKAELERLQRADWSVHTGKTTVAVDERGVHVRSPSRELRLSWTAVAPVKGGEFVVLQYAGGDGTIIPPRAFASQAAAGEFLEQAQRWWSAAQLPNAERVTQYLAERDFPCPRCGYNLRGIRGEACPECAEPIRFEVLLGQ